MSDPQPDLNQVQQIIESNPDIANARVEARRRELMYRGAGATIAMWLGGLMVAAIAITWILKLAGVL